MIKKKYKYNFNEYQLNIFKTIDNNGHKVFNLESVYSYLIKYSNKESNKVTKSLNRLHGMYIIHHKKKDLLSGATSELSSISKSYFYTLVENLIDLNLIKKEGRSIFIKYSSEEKMEEKVEIQKPCESVETTSLEGGLENPNSKSLSDYSVYTNTNIVKMIGEYYKGIKAKKYASKQDLFDVAKSLFKLDRINEPVVQATVMSKLKNSKQQIHLNGIVQYVRCVIMDKLSEFDAACF